MYSTDTHSSPHAGPTPAAVRAAKPACYSRLYSGTSAKPVIAHGSELSDVLSDAANRRGHPTLG